MNQLQSIGFNRQQRVFYVEFTTQNRELWGQRPSLILELSTKSIKTPPIRRQHKVLGYPVVKYRPKFKTAYITSFSFTVQSEKTRIPVPVTALRKVHPYAGQSLSLSAEFVVQHDKKVLARLPIQSTALETEALETQDEILTIPERCRLVQMMQALTPDERNDMLGQLGMFVLILSLIGGAVAVSAYFSLMNPDVGDFLSDSNGFLLVVFLAGVFVYLPNLYKQLAERFFKAYIVLDKKEPRTLRPNDVLQLGDLCAVRTKTPLKWIRVRLVAVQEECFVYQATHQKGQYQNGSNLEGLSPDKALSELGGVDRDMFDGPDLLRVSCERYQEIVYDYAHRSPVKHWVLLDTVLTDIQAGGALKAAVMQKPLPVKL